MTHLIGLVSDLLHCRTKAELPARAAAIDDHRSLVADNSKPVLVIAAHSALTRSLAPKLT